MPATPALEHIQDLVGAYINFLHPMLNLVTKRARTAPPVQSVAAAKKAKGPSARTFFDTLSFTQRKEWVRWIEESRRPETRVARLARTIDGLTSGQRTH